MAVVSFYVLGDDFAALGEWLNRQSDLAVLLPLENERFVATRNVTWNLPIWRRYLWCTSGPPPQALTHDFFKVSDPWSPFSARDIYQGSSILTARILAEVKPRRIGLSSIQCFAHREDVAVKQVWRRVRAQIVRSGVVIDKLAGEPRFAFPAAERAIRDEGYSFARDPFQ
jgi:hypothetical protein